MTTEQLRDQRLAQEIRLTELKIILAAGRRGSQSKALPRLADKLRSKMAQRRALWPRVVRSVMLHEFSRRPVSGDTGAGSKNAQ